jgi:hypothetical protein
MHTATLGSLDLHTPILSKGDYFARESHEFESTPVTLTSASPGLREAITSFAETLNPIYDHELVRVVRGAGGSTLLSTSAAVGRVLVVRIGKVTETKADDVDVADPHGTADALPTFDRLVIELGVSKKEMEQATGIKHRTYHSWRKPSAPKPRTASVGRLWHLADAVTDLREVLERPLAAWLHAAPERMAAFRAGDFERLVDLAVDMRTDRDRRKTVGTSQRVGLAADVDMPVLRATKPSISDVEPGLRR